MDDETPRPSMSPAAARSRTQERNGSLSALNTELSQAKSGTFFEDTTPIDRRKVKERDSEERNIDRDSHDLSLSNITRDSVVDNMLLSLDQISSSSPPFTNYANLYGNFDDANYFDSAPGPSQSIRTKGHSHNASCSSDYDLHQDDNSSRYSSHPSRGRRSNSSIGFSSNVQRMGSLRGGHRSATMSPETHGRARYDGAKYPAHIRGGTSRVGSKGSAGSSSDLGYNNQIFGPSIGGHISRSQSFDQDFTRGLPAKSQPNGVLSPPGRASPTLYEDFDAAPTPTIPTGQRRRDRIDCPSSPPMYMPQPGFSPTTATVPSSRRNSIRSAKSRGGKSTKSQPADPASIRAQATEFVNANSNNNSDIPPVPPLHAPSQSQDGADPAAPSPSIAYRKQAGNSRPSTGQPTPRPGFFRRVFGFGGGKENNNPQEKPQPQPQAPPASAPVTTDDKQAKPAQDTGSNITSPKPVPQQARPGASTSQGDSQKPTTLQTLTKKHSSFFRRKKKSLSEEPPPPELPAHLHKPIDFMSATPSPGISSLQKAMDPYLTSPSVTKNAGYENGEQQPAIEEPFIDEQKDVTAFSPGYQPHKDATVRAVKPGSSGTDQSVPPSREGANAPDVVHQDNPKLKLKVNRERGNTDAQDENLLADSTGSEARDKLSTTVSTSRANQRPQSSPTSPSFLYTESMPQSTTLSGRRPSGKRLKDLSPTDRLDASLTEEDDEFVLTPRPQDPTKEPASNNRLWLEPDDAEERPVDANKLSPTSGGKRSNNNSPLSSGLPTPTPGKEGYQSATSLPTLQLDHGAMPEDEPTDEDRDTAQRIFDGDEEGISKAKAAAWLGESAPVRKRTRRAYMQLFEWTGFSILMAMRDLCNRIVLKGETQQVDRIIDALSTRWVECNPNHGFKDADVVHTMCYSLLLLNTDLHVAEIENKMTKGQFVKNTLPTIRRIVEDQAEEEPSSALSASQMSHRGSSSRPGSMWGRAESPVIPLEPPSERTSFDQGRPKIKNRLSILAPLRTESYDASPSPDAPHGDACNILVNAPYSGDFKGWENQIEIVLKEFYSSIRSQRLPLHNPGSRRPSALPHEPSSNSLTVNNKLRRTPSVLSKAPSENLSYRGRTPEMRSATSRWQSRNRQRGRLYPASTVGSSRTSLDDQSFWSPAASSTWSRSLGRTQPSMMSVESFGSHFAPGDFQQSIGFAHALGQAIIREEGMSITSDESYGRQVPLLEDESLGLHGAPWAKEGIVKHKHHLEGPEKKAKDRNWSECFAVIEKGTMKLFNFNQQSKSLRQKLKNRPSTGGIVGGGNWSENAEDMGQFPLRHTIASSLPPPGYSKTRPHVFALSLPTGAVHFFQVGTPDIVKEFVSTANYWAARLSKEPLVGGVSNIEHGWSEAVINPALVGSNQQPPGSSDSNHPPGTSHSSNHSVNMPRQSMQSSIRSSMDHQTGQARARLPGDKVTITDYQPPAQSLMASNLMEVDQRNALEGYVKGIEAELNKHQELRVPMLYAFSPRHPNHAKAMANWEKKSAYLLREIVKYRTYMDTLSHAQVEQERIHKERGIEEEEQGIPAPDEAIIDDEEDLDDTIMPQNGPPSPDPEIAAIMNEPKTTLDVKKSIEALGPMRN